MNTNRAIGYARIMLGKRTLTAAVMIHASILAPSAWAHAKLIVAEPKAEAIVSVAPAAIRLQFNDQVELPFSKVKLIDAKDASIDALAILPDQADPKALVATLPPLPAGVYRVLWSTVTRDGHKAKGEYAFSVK